MTKEHKKIIDMLYFDYVESISLKEANEDGEALILKMSDELDELLTTDEQRKAALKFADAQCDYRTNILIKYFHAGYRAAINLLKQLK